jgi:hypothetical protein
MSLVNTTKYPQKTSLKCHECGSYLLLVGQEIETGVGQYSPVTTSIYNCSNPECQADFEKKTAQRMKIHKEQEVAKQKRIEKMKNRKKVA